MLHTLIAEATECDFKQELERKKPKSWLKSVSAFANGIGGTLFSVWKMIIPSWAWKMRRRMLRTSAARSRSAFPRFYFDA